MNKIGDGILGFCMFTAGMIGLGYAIGTRKKMKHVGALLDKSIDELANSTPVDISEDMVSKAVDRAVEREASKAVTRATALALSEVREDIHKKVKAAVDKEYEALKENVLKEIVEESSKIDYRRVRNEVEKAAKENALEKFDENLDEITEKFKDDLDSMVKFHKSIANIMGKKDEKEIVLKVV